MDFPGQQLGAELTFQISNLKYQYLHVSFLRPFNFSREDSSIPPRRCEPVYLLEPGVEPGSSSAGVLISIGLSGFQPTPSAGLTVPPSWGLRPLGWDGGAGGVLRVSGFTPSLSAPYSPLSLVWPGGWALHTLSSPSKLTHFSPLHSSPLFLLVLYLPVIYHFYLFCIFLNSFTFFTFLLVSRGSPNKCR